MRVRGDRAVTTTRRCFSVIIAYVGALSILSCEQPPAERSGPDASDAAVAGDGIFRDQGFPDADATIGDGRGPSNDGAREVADSAASDDGAPIKDAITLGPSRDAASYSIVVLPDTQYYSSSWPDIFAAQTRWIVDNRAAQGIAFVLHVGDIVDSDVPEQWGVAARSLGLLDGELPYVLAAGNHDYQNLADRTGLVDAYFSPAHFAQYSWFQGTFEEGRAENSFSLFDVGATRWLVIALEFGPRDEVLTWANAVLSLCHENPAIVITHAFLDHTGARYDHTQQGGGARFNPHDYVMMGQIGSSINDGQEMWQKLIEPNSNIKFVFSGHDVAPSQALPPGTAARLTSTRPDGTRVHQILANYQTCIEAPCQVNKDGVTVHGGDGFLRILRFRPNDHAVDITTYSPYVDQYLTDDANQFTLPLD